MRMRSTTITISTLALLAGHALAAPAARVTHASMAAESTDMTFADATWTARSLTATPVSKPVMVGNDAWTAVRDADTNVPVRMWGRGVRAAGSVANPAVAEAAARAFMQTQLADLAPGATLSDFVLVANERNPAGDMRTVAFEQQYQGLNVLGGAISFAFKNDALFLVGSTALPNVTIAVPTSALAPRAAGQRAASWLAQTQGVAMRVRSTAPARVIVPMVQRKNGIATSVQYRVATVNEVEATAGVGRWQVFVDAANGTPLARTSLIHYAQGKVMYNVPLRSPIGGRGPQPAIMANHLLPGESVTSDLQGNVSWAGTAATSVSPGLIGPRVTVTTGAGSTPTASLTLAPNGTAVWSVTTEAEEAQLAAFVHANVAKQYAKANLNPGLAYLERQLSVTVNESGSCNAYSTGDDIHFYPRDQQCENTGLLADVVYHEFGHSLHANSLVRGAGQFDSALSEGLADFLAASITGDPGMGRGFFFSNEALRDIDPTNHEARWPNDRSTDPHATGEIIGGALWDMRKALITKLGTTAGIALTSKLYYAVMQRAPNIESSFIEVLAADDDDGDVSNGTPNVCELINAFKPHGLVDVAAITGLQPPVRDGFKLAVAVNAGSQVACNVPTIASAQVQWKVRGDAAAQGNFELANGAAGWTGEIPTQANGKIVQYRVNVSFSDGSVVSYPNNPVDPFYEFAVDERQPIWCADFESGANDWTKTSTWTVGATGAGKYNPKAAFAGASFLGLALTGSGQYKARATASAQSPEVDVAGFSNVHLQYRRWLSVEDGFFDQAKILANGTKVWSNYASATDPDDNGHHHVDQEWRFVDLDITNQAKSGKVKLSFELTADDGLNFGGWNLDNVCLVGTPLQACGNGTTEGAESCDDGNTADGDGCSATCSNEEGGGGGGCSSNGTSPANSAIVLLALAGMGLAARRRHAA